MFNDTEIFEMFEILNGVEFFDCSITDFIDDCIEGSDIILVDDYYSQFE